MTAYFKIAPPDALPEPPLYIVASLCPQGTHHAHALTHVHSHTRDL